ncbi:hypothetical protein OXYTRIMIC_779 [Oxytricha trifallax]|uniref:Uncharacterized protein n=1 Tax=Oxytricha trifallax TaxID=1172189 RepID=A0A073HZS2_9SPIT|nr:hypothetical protein OXYTRIMIC_779 [Oxytricha trifallax]
MFLCNDQITGRGYVYVLKDTVQFAVRMLRKTVRPSGQWSQQQSMQSVLLTTEHKKRFSPGVTLKPGFKWVT